MWHVHMHLGNDLYCTTDSHAHLEILIPFLQRLNAVRYKLQGRAVGLQGLQCSPGQRSDMRARLRCRVAPQQHPMEQAAHAGALVLLLQRRCGSLHELPVRGEGVACMGAQGQQSMHAVTRCAHMGNCMCGCRLLAGVAQYCAVHIAHGKHAYVQEDWHRGGQEAVQRCMVAK